MNDKVMQALFESASDAIEVGLSTAQELLDKAQAVLDNVATELMEWQAETGGSEVTNQDKYDYVYTHSDEWEKNIVELSKDFLLDDEEILDALYQSKLAQEAGKDNHDFPYWLKQFNKYM